MNSIKKILQVSVNNFWLKFIYLLVLLIIMFPYYRLITPPEAGIDNSWRMALEMAKAKGLIWGKDIIYTYGPLGTWLQRYDITTSRFELMLTDMFTFVNVGILLYRWLPNPTKLYHLFIHFTIYAIVSAMHGEWVHFMLFFAGIYWGFETINDKISAQKRNLVLIYTIFLSILNYFIKANYGIIGFGFSFVLIVYLAISKRITIKLAAIFLVSTVIALILASKFLNTDLLNYTISNLHIISGYNEAMAVYPSNWSIIVAFSYLTFGIITLIIFGYIIFNIKNVLNLNNIKKLDDIFLLLSVVTISFILLKYGFVRADEGHVTAFAKLVSLPFLLVIFFANNHILKYIFSGILALNLLIYIFIYQPVFGNLEFKYHLTLQHKSHIIPEYFTDAFENKRTPKPKPFFPKDILESIGNQTVDVVPQEISDVYFNQLNYNPRPIVQSYQAYNEYLDLKNREKYLSSTAPDWIIYSIESTDNKYAWAEETQTLLAMLQRYRVEKEWKTRLFLKKNDVIRKLELVKTTTEKAKINQEIQVQNDSTLIHVIKIKTNYNLFGKILKFAFQPPQLYMQMQSSKLETNRVIPIHLEKGMVINSRIDNIEDAKQFFEKQNVPSKTVKSIRFYEQIRGKAGFAEDIEIVHEWYRLL
ncbi:MAG: hypothetical protein ACK4NY_12640 [Spirosomataceae bacterium]